MWSNFLDADVVKDFVAFGTEIVKIIDEIGLLGSALIALAAYKGFGAVFDVFRSAGISVDFLTKKLGSYVFGINTAAAAETTLTQAQVAQRLAQQGLTAEQAQAIAAQTGLATSTANLSRETLIASLQAKGYSAAEAEAIATKIFGTAVTNASTGALIQETIKLKLANSALVQYAIQMGYATAAEVANMGITQLLGLSFSTLAKTIGTATVALAKFLFTYPVGWVILAAGAIAGGIAAWNKWGDTTENLSEELSNLKSELQDIESEIDSLNSELEAANERMAELIAMPSLSFIEQEELNNLKLATAELERQLKLKEMLADSKEDTFVTTSEQYINKVWNSNGVDKSYHVSSDGTIRKDEGWHGFWNAGEDTKSILDSAIEGYETARIGYDRAQTVLSQWSDDEEKNKELLKQYGFQEYTNKEALEEIAEGYKKRRDKNAEGINMILGDENFDNLEYGMSDEIDAFLDELYAYGLKFRQAQGEYIKSEAISTMFDSSSTGQMQEFGKALKEIVNSDLTDEEKNVEILKQLDGIDGVIGDGVNKIEGKTDAYNRLHLAMETVGVTAQDIADYFVLHTGAFDSNTIEGITNQYQHMESVINALKSMSDGKFTFDGTEYNWSEFFSQDDQGKFKANAVEFSNILKGMDEKSRETFINIVESAANSAGDLSQIDWDQALSKLDFSGIDRTFELLNNEFEALNNEMFAGAADDINGLIDTVSELQAALEDVAGTMDLVRTAQEQMNSSGRISTKTALELMQTTEDWDQILEITNGTIKLRDGAEQHLIQTELTAIKTQLHYAWTTAQARYETALAAQGELDYASNSGIVMTAESIKAEAIGRVSAVVVALGAAMDELMAGNWGSVFSAFGDTYKTATETVVQDSQKLTTSVSELKKDADKAKKLYEAFESVDSFEEFMENYDFDGDTYEDVLANRWDEIINKYENKLALINNERDRVQAEIDAAEARGGQASKEMYDDLIRLELEEKQLLEDKKEELEAYMAIYGNSLDPETWTEYNNEINATAVAIKEATTNIYEFAQSLRDIDMHYFEQANDEISRLADEIDWVMSLFEDEDMYDEAGNLTEAGVTKINLLRDQMTAYASLAKRWGDELTRLEGMEKGENGLYEFDEDTKNAIAADFQSMFDSGKIDKDTYDAYMKQLNDAWTAGGFSEEVYNDWVNAAEDGMRDAISSQKNVQNRLIEMNEERIDKIEEGINREIEAYEDLIDAQKEELDAARELNDFRKQVANDSKDIQELERRIASLSGSTAAADIAERRKLEAELNQKKSDLNDAYYDHSHDAQSNALNDEAEAFRSAGERYVEYLRERGKDTATVLNDMFLNGIFNADVANDFLLRIQEKYGAPLSVELTEPWALAASQAEAYKSSVNIITGENIPAYVTSLSDTIINQLADGSQKNPWGKAVNAAKTYSDFLSETEFGLPENQLTTFIDELDDIVDKWEAVQTAANNAYDAQERTYNVGGTPGASPGNNNGDGNGGGGDGSGGLPEYSKAVEDLQKILNFFFGAGMYVDGIFGPTTRSWVKEMQKTMGLAASGKYDDKTYKKLMEYIRNRGNVGSWFKQNNVVIPGPMSYAKGTTGTARDEWAITDEPQFGDELVLVPGKDGNLSFMRKGTGVVPADLTANLMEWGQFTPDSLNLGGGVNVNMINNAVNKPEFNFAFDALVKAENITEETLPAVKKLVTQELNRFTKELNYALKGKGAR